MKPARKPTADADTHQHWRDDGRARLASTVCPECAVRCRQCGCCPLCRIEWPIGGQS